MDKIDQFLEELNILSKKYGLVIGGGDHYASPCIEDIDNGKEEADLLNWDSQTNTYSVRKIKLIQSK